MLDLDELLRFAVERDASDVHVKVGSPPFVRVDGHLERTAFPDVTPADAEEVARAVLPGPRAEELDAHGDTDFAYGVAGVGRFRVNVHRQRGSIGVVLRRVIPGIPGLTELGLPPSVQQLADEDRGLVLVTGPARSGKTTTLAALVDHVNATRRRHIVTIEDPIEVLHKDKESFVTQREIGTDAETMPAALAHVLRADPDVVLVGDIPDAETLAATLVAAETGQLVLAAMPTPTANDTINRIADFFPPHLQRQVRTSLAGVLRGIVSQRLVDRADGNGRVPAVEVLVNTPRVFDKIVAPDEGQELAQIMAEGEYYGMRSLDQSLFELFEAGLITRRDALAHASNPGGMRLAIQKLPGPALEAADVPPRAATA